MITILQKRLETQNQYIEQMKKETAEMKASMDLIQQNMILDQKKEAANRAWQSAITAQLTKTNDAAIRQDKSIESLKSHATKTSEALQQIMAHLKIVSPPITDARQHQAHEANEQPAHITPSPPGVEEI